MPRFFKAISLVPQIMRNHEVTVTQSMFYSLLPDVGSAEGLAYDPFYDYLYWTSYTNSSISRISVNPHQSNPQRQKIVQLGPADKPRAIALHTCSSWVTIAAFVSSLGNQIAYSSLVVS